MTWSARQYLKFEDERTRPARDLLAQVPDLPDGGRYDLGCGPGNSTALIAARFGGAALCGIDSDADMLQTATDRLPHLPFVAGDLSTWRPPALASLFFANAVFQWLPDHLAVFDRLMRDLVPGGVLAVQMPDNMREPTHILMQEVASDARFARYFPGGPPARAPLHAPAVYIDHLARHAHHVEVWHTIYYHRLADAEAIVEWVRGTGLRPYLDALPDDARDDYLAAYRDRIKLAYPPMQDGRTLLRFPRLFIVAVKQQA